MTHLPIILDIEASGFGVGSYPIEIGYADARGETWCALVQPQQDWTHWDNHAAGLHQLNRETLLQHGLAPKVIAQHLNQVFLNQVVYSDGWLNDFVWLSRLYDAAEMRPHFRLEDLRLVLGAQQLSQWHQTKQTLQQARQDARHRASADAKLLQDTWRHTALTEILV